MKYCLKTFWNSFLTFKGTRKLKNEYFQAVFKNKKKNGFWLLFQTNEATFKLWCYFFRDLDVGLTKVCLKTKTKVMKQNLGSLLFYKIRQVPVSKVPKFFEYWHHKTLSGHKRVVFPGRNLFSQADFVKGWDSFSHVKFFS